MIKKKFFGLAAGLLIMLTFSCLGDYDTETDDWNWGNAQIASFSLSNDSIDGLSNVVFTIDQINNRIFNKDSMPYGTVIDRKVIVTVTFDLGAQAILLVSTATNDSIWDISDSVDFSAPVIITVYPYDGVSTKTYEAQLNIHQVNPDSIVWNGNTELMPEKQFDDMKVLLYGDYYLMYAQEESGFNYYKAHAGEPEIWENQTLNGFPSNASISQIVEYKDILYLHTEDGELFSSPDGSDWSKVAEAPVITTLIGSIPAEEANTKPVLSGITEQEGVLRFITMDSVGVWTAGSVVPEQFPLTGFSTTNYLLMHYPRLTIASGRCGNDELSDKAWSTLDGLNYAPLTNANVAFTPREGASIAFYDDSLYLVGGIDASGTPLNEIYTSRDNGITWRLTEYTMSEDYSARGFTSLIIDKDNYMLLFGGKANKNSKAFNHLWRGRINRLGFENR